MEIAKNANQNIQICEWSFEQLRELCRLRGVPESTIYQNSLEYRWRRADFHAEKAEKIWKELFSTSFSTAEQRFHEAVFSYEAHVEACIQCLHSMGDLLGQIINVVILEKRFKEDQVSLKNLAECGIPLQIGEPLNELLISNEFMYIDAFCNTIKHRCLIPRMFSSEYGGDYRSESGIKFMQFDYKSNTYPETWATDVLRKYRYSLLKLITRVGVAVNNFLAEGKS